MKIPKRITDTVDSIIKNEKEFNLLYEENDGIYDEYIFPFIKDNQTNTDYVFDKFDVIDRDLWIHDTPIHQVWKYKQYVLNYKFPNEYNIKYCQPWNAKSPVKYDNIDDAIQRSIDINRIIRNLMDEYSKLDDVMRKWGNTVEKLEAIINLFSSDYHYRVVLSLYLRTMRNNNKDVVDENS